MKFTFAAFLAALVTTSLAQSIDIGAPANGTRVTPGSTIVVRVEQPDNLTGESEIAVVIGILSCGNGPCLPAGEALGTVLYNGPFDPVFSMPQNSLPPNQNFTVTIPTTLTVDPAQLSVFHVALVGASTVPLAETKAIILDVV